MVKLKEVLASCSNFFLFNYWTVYEIIKIFSPHAHDRLGGIYFIISRSLGAEFGASVGIVLAFANAVSASLNTIGFCESLNDLLWQRYHTKILENNIDSIRLVGVIAIFVMILICALGIEWESKVIINEIECQNREIKGYCRL